MLLHNKGDYLLVVARRVGSLSLALHPNSLYASQEYLLVGIKLSAQVTALKVPFRKADTGKRCPRLPI